MNKSFHYHSYFLLHPYPCPYKSYKHNVWIHTYFFRPFSRLLELVQVVLSINFIPRSLIQGFLIEY